MSNNLRSPNYVILLILVLSLLFGCKLTISKTIEPPSAEQKNEYPAESLNDSYLNKSNTYLISKFGQNFFDRYITYSGISLYGKGNEGGMAIVCLKNRTPPNTTVYTFLYKLNPHEFTDFKERSLDPTRRIGVMYAQNELFCTLGVVDCISHPLNCPPFKVNSSTEALRIFNNSELFKSSQVTFDFVGRDSSFNYANLDSYDNSLNYSGVRFAWIVTNSTEYERLDVRSWDGILRVAHINPSTGEIKAFSNRIINKQYNHSSTITILKK